MINIHGVNILINIHGVVGIKNIHGNTYSQGQWNIGALGEICAFLCEMSVFYVKSMRFYVKYMCV